MEAILINRMYAGEYLTKGIGGGETINLLLADDGINYCYIQKVGLLNPTYNNTVKYVLNTRLHEAGCFEIIGVCVIKEQLIEAKGATSAQRGKNAVKELVEYVKKHPINYGGVPYIKGTEDYPPITFASSKLLFPKEQVFILDKDYNKKISDNFKTFKLTDKKFSRQSLLMYVDTINNKESFETIKAMVDEEDLWEEKDTRLDQYKETNHFNFLSLIRKEDDELAFSNMFSYFFNNYPNLFKGFIKEVLKEDISYDYEIKREFHNIDLWVEDKGNNRVIVIENKIKSGINGVSPRHDFSEDGLVQSQLLKYYKFAVDYIKDEDKVECFICVPNYNKIDLKAYKGSKHYTEIKYKEIYNYLITQTVDNVYYRDFVNALYKHTKDVPIDYSEELLNYMIKKVNKEKRKV